MKRSALSLALARRRRPSAFRPSGRHPRADPGQGERRHHHQDRPRAAADRGAAAARSRISGPDNDAELQKALAEITPDVIVDAVDELLLVQRGRELGYTLGNEQFQQHHREHQEREQARDRRAVPGRAQAGRHDARRSAQAARAQDAGQPRPADRGDGQDQRHRRRNEEVLRQPTRTPSPRRRSSRCARSWWRCRPATRASTSRQDDEAKAKAEDCASASRPASRSRSSRRESSDSPSKANGGLIGPISRDDSSPELQKQIDAARSPAR